MNKHLYATFALSLVISLGLLAGCGPKNRAVDQVDGVIAASDTISEELVHHAYDAIFVLTLATLAAPDEEHGLTVESDDKNATFTFKNTPYLNDAPDAVVSGVMKAINTETEDRSEVSLTFENDPVGLKSITIESTGPHGVSHTEGAMSINGVEKPFKEFVDYFAAKAQVQMTEASDVSEVDTQE